MHVSLIAFFSGVPITKGKEKRSVLQWVCLYSCECVEEMNAVWVQCFLSQASDDCDMHTQVNFWLNVKVMLM